MVFKASVGHVVVILAVCWIISFGSSDGFGLDVHHRYSDTVKDFLGVEGLPEKDSFDYFAAMAHRDHLSHARRLATSPASSPFLTFLKGNQTYRLDDLGFLHYTVATVGTPAVNFLVALDTFDSLFWLPCECVNCARTWNTSDTSIKLNMYSPTTSSSSSKVPCNSTLCDRRRSCSLSRNACAYQEVYNPTTSSTGILVNDVLALTTDDQTQTPVDVPITLGCGIVQTGDFVTAAAINGLMGLGLDKISVPSILASKGLAPDSFSMCFGADGYGRIEFGDKGTPDQKTTPLNAQSSIPGYNVSVTQVSVGVNVNNVAFTADVETSTSFIYLSDPAYTFITTNFDSQVKEPRFQPARKLVFEYCYSLGVTQNPSFTPNVNFTFKGGDQFTVDPIFVFPLQGGGYIYCLAIIKTQGINTLGQNFWSGYRIVFDREEMHLGWSESNCYDAPGLKGNTGSDAPPPPFVFTPTASPRSINRTTTSSPPPPSSPRLPFGNGAVRIFTSTTNGGLFMIIVSMLFIML